MKPTLNEKLIAYLTLISGLSISAVAVYYSVVGLTAIFAAAFIPIVIMGVVLEVGKLIATLWLKQNWNIAPKTIKTYLITAIVVLMFITSMGIFGFLSKSHSDQSLISGDVQSKLAIYDEKIKTAKENIEADRKQLKQMDEAVDQVMARSTTEEGAAKSNAIRKAQARDRSALAKSIEANQKLIAAINDEAAPIRAEIRKVEAEVGPLKYIANFIYGETDKNLLEKAVTWVIVIIVLVFDPLAVVLLLASQISFQNFRQQHTLETKNISLPVEEPVKQAENNFPEILKEEIILEEQPKKEKEFDIKDHPYLFKTPQSYHPPGVETVGPQVYKEEKIILSEPEKDFEIEKIEKLIDDIETNVEKLYGLEETKPEIVPQITTITSEDYQNISQEKLEEKINYYASLLREKKILATDIPKELIQEVKSRV